MKTLTQLAKGLDFEHDYQYFDYIIESKINGQNSQVRKLYNEMSPPDQKDFRDYIQDSETYKEIIEIILN